MEIEEFITLFKEKIAQLDALKILIENGYDKEKKEFYYAEGDVTFLFNCVVFDIVKEYKKVDLDIAVRVENPLGKGAYSDLVIGSWENKEDYIEIEHENKPENKDKKDKKKTKIQWCIEKLGTKSHAKYKLLITYFDTDSLSNELKTKIQRFVNEYFKAGEVLYLLYSPWEGEFNYQLERFCSGDKNALPLSNL